MEVLQKIDVQKEVNAFLRREDLKGIELTVKKKFINTTTELTKTANETADLEKKLHELEAERFRLQGAQRELVGIITSLVENVEAENKEG